MGLVSPPALLFLPSGWARQHCPCLVRPCRGEQEAGSVLWLSGPPGWTLPRLYFQGQPYRIAQVRWRGHPPECCSFHSVTAVGELGRQSGFLSLEPKSISKQITKLLGFDAEQKTIILRTRSVSFFFFIAGGNVKVGQHLQ